MPGYARSALCWLAGSLATLLVWGFLPLSTEHRVMLSCALLLMVIAGCMWVRRQSRQLQSTVEQSATWQLPATGFDGALVLVCGAGSLMFSDQDSPRQTQQGWYLNTPTPESFALAVEWIAATAPALLNQLSVAFCIAPECHQDEAQLRGEIRQWRMQFAFSRRQLSRVPAIVLCGYVNGMTVTEKAPADWFVYDGENRSQDINVYAEDGGCLTLARWGQQGDGQWRMAQMLWLDALLGWLKAVIIDELCQPQTRLPAVPLTAIAVTFTPLCGVENNLWQRIIRQRTTLVPALSPDNASTAMGLPFPDCLLPLLPVRQGLTPAQHLKLSVGGIVALFFMTALLSSFANNHRLIRSIGADLALYHRLTGSPPEPKTLAQQQLRRDEQQLARYQRQGPPLSLGLGLYQGMVLYPALQAAISDWVSPSPATPHPTLPTVEKAPQTLRLDSLSLFDTGKAMLKPASTQVLQNALLNIKAKPGWLIVIAGHTDSTGNAQTNQQLSLKRAEAVRDWLVQTGGMPPGCFAVQGLGASQPLATNQTEAGRAANRRVEISLLPQADACQAAGALSASSARDGAITSKMEK
ncbi:OmpA family protein [Serratia aquatilis]|uniref:OmpA family protein n=1 Tax=Serratia aquatilis TaxID=1737515 RepID=A0ABV6EJH2_9GAMM